MTEPTIITETDSYFVINKPAGLAVEPPSHAETLRDWLIKSQRINPASWPEAERYGVVHRLDADTSGVLIWAKNPTAQAELKRLWQGRQVEKTYLALVAGEMDKSGVVELPIARDNRADKMTALWLDDGRGRAAITRYGVQAVGQIGNRVVSLIEAEPVTGRTHQIRVHLKAVGHPIIGDKLYGDKTTAEIAKTLGLNRQFLHAWHLVLTPNPLVPELSQRPSYTAPVPDELRQVLAKVGIDPKTVDKFN